MGAVRRRRACGRRSGPRRRPWRSWSAPAAPRRSGGLTEQLEQDDLLLEGLEHGADRGVEVGAEPREVRRATDDDPGIGPLVGEGLRQGGHDRGDDRLVLRVERRDEVGDLDRGVGEAHPEDHGQDAGAQVGEEPVAQGRRELDGALLDASGARDDDDEHPVLVEGHELDVTDRRAGQAGVLHDCDLARELGEDPHAALHDVVDVDRLRQEPLDRATLGRRECLDGGQPVDEHPVALVGGDPPGRRVGLGEIALVLQHRHVVADGGRGHPEVVALDQRAGAHGLLRGDVVLDDGPQDVEATIVGHRASPRRVAGTLGVRLPV